MTTSDMKETGLEGAEDDSEEDRGGEDLDISVVGKEENGRVRKKIEVQRLSTRNGR